MAFRVKWRSWFRKTTVPVGNSLSSLSGSPSVFQHRETHISVVTQRIDAKSPSIFPEAACQLLSRETESLAAWRSASASLAAPIGSYFRRKRSSTSAGAVSGVPL